MRRVWFPAVCLVSVAMTVAAGSRAQVSSGQNAPATTSPGLPRISGGVMAANIVSKVSPVYAADAKASGVQGTVVLHVIVGEDGRVQNATVISGPEALRQAAIDAVSQWVYKPFLLNGRPTAVDTTVTVNFSLSS